MPSRRRARARIESPPRLKRDQLNRLASIDALIVCVAAFGQRPDLHNIARHSHHDSHKAVLGRILKRYRFNVAAIPPDMRLEYDAAFQEQDFMTHYFMTKCSTACGFKSDIAVWSNETFLEILTRQWCCDEDDSNATDQEILSHGIELELKLQTLKECIQQLFTPNVQLDAMRPCNRADACHRTIHRLTWAVPPEILRVRFKDRFVHPPLARLAEPFTVCYSERGSNQDAEAAYRPIGFLAERTGGSTTRCTVCLKHPTDERLILSYQTPLKMDLKCEDKTILGLEGRLMDYLPDNQVIRIMYYAMSFQRRGGEDSWRKVDASWNVPTLME